MLTEPTSITGRKDAGDCSRPVQALCEKLFTGPNRVQVEFLDYSIETADCFIAIGRERGTLTAADGRTLDLRIRTSRVFRRDCPFPRKGEVPPVEMRWWNRFGAAVFAFSGYRDGDFRRLRNAW